MKPKAVILNNQVMTGNPDEVDVIHQRDLVKKACENLGFTVSCLEVGRDMMGDIEKVKLEKPEVVFNLVEAAWGKGELIYFAPAILNAFKIPYTGVPLDALFVTTNKVLAKKMMRHHQLPTADFYSIREIDQLNPKKTYIAKPIWEEASVGISSDYIFQPSDKEKLEAIRQLNNSHYFIEEFIDGREFNISILSRQGKAEILPPAEIIFSDYFEHKHKIVGYKAKWDEDSEEYKHTNRAFGTLEDQPQLKKKLTYICEKAWQVFNLKGYVRIDFRVDTQDRICILEINGNPCIAPDSGFVAALGQAGYSNEVMVKRIMEDLNG
jgi:D-alanine-D-alanine ligase